MTAAVAVVTDSTACLSAELAAEGGILVVPLRVVFGDRAADQDAADGEPADQDALDHDAAVTVAEVERALHDGRRIGTASPAPGRFAAAYAAAAAQGAEFIVSVHLSARLSGTLNSASLAAAGAPVPVRVVDSRSIGMGLGIAASRRRRQPGRARMRPPLPPRRPAAPPGSDRSSPWIPRATCAPAVG